MGSIRDASSSKLGSPLRSSPANDSKPIHVTRVPGADAHRQLSAKATAQVLNISTDADSLLSGEGRQMGATPSPSFGRGATGPSAKQDAPRPAGLVRDDAPSRASAGSRQQRVRIVESPEKASQAAPKFSKERSDASFPPV